MVVRSILFAFEDTKDLAIYMTKNLIGTIDVENLAKDNPHIDMIPFHFVIFLMNPSKENQNIFFTKLKQYEKYLSLKEVYLCLTSNESLEKGLPSYFKTIYINKDDNSYINSINIALEQKKNS